jgi:four helix bundle protein
MRDERGRDLKSRTKTFALEIIKMYSSLPKSTVAQVIGRQVLRSGTSVGAHYREAIRGRSDAEFISKLEGGLQELEETTYWLELLVDSGVVKLDAVSSLLDECDQLTAILTTCVKNVKRKNS